MNQGLLGIITAGVGVFDGVGMSPLNEVFVSDGQLAPQLDLQPISQSYRHAIVICQTRSDQAVTQSSLLMRINGDSGSNYVRNQVFGQSTSAFGGNSAGETSMNMGNTSGGNNTASHFGGLAIFLPNYSARGGLSFKNVIAFGGIYAPADGYGTIDAEIGAWKSTEPINWLTFLPGGGNFVPGTRISIHGIA